jgi:DnaJ-class molecular chaperone
MADPYKTLGVKRGDSDDDIRTAYRKLAKKHHPDLNQGKPDAADRFKSISAAYDILSDKDKRARFDRGEIDDEGRETAAGRAASGAGGPWGGGPPPGAGPYQSGMAGNAEWRGYPRGDTFSGIGPDDLETLFGQGFGGGTTPQGRDIRYAVSVSFIEAANGTSRRLVLHDGRELDVAIPVGVRDGQVLRLKGQGRRGLASAGDAVVDVQVTPHRFFRREGEDILLDLPITLHEATLGATVEVPTVRGSVRLTIPPGSGSGARLRLKGRGIGGGNQIVILKPVLAPGVEPALADFLRSWQPTQPFNPREDMEEG